MANDLAPCYMIGQLDFYNKQNPENQNLHFCIQDEKTVSHTRETPELCLLGVVVVLVEPEGERGELPLRIHENVVLRQRRKLQLN